MGRDRAVYGYPVSHYVVNFDHVLASKRELHREGSSLAISSRASRVEFFSQDDSLTLVLSTKLQVDHRASSLDRFFLLFFISKPKLRINFYLGLRFP
jgi:hypothetical protein